MNAAAMPPETRDTPASPEAPKPRILLVDDERSILSALRRMLRPQGYTIHLAGSGAEALAFLEENTVDLIVSDMRMPQMSGAELLKECLVRWPDVPRVLLTGYADLASTISAINDGQIFRYVNKPWDDDALREVIAQAIEFRMVRQERDRLTALTRAQNEELTELNEALEARVRERTAKVVESANLLREANQQLEESYRTTVDVFGSLLASRARVPRREVRDMVSEATLIGEALGMSPSELEQLGHACLLCDLGKLTLPDALARAPALMLSGDDRKLFESHPVEADSALMALEPLEAAAGMIRAHRECFDGKGYPDRLAGDDIPLGSRILAVVKDFRLLMAGMLLKERLSPAAAADYLKDNAGSRYDPAVVERFIEGLGAASRTATGGSEQKLTTGSLKAGMQLTRDLVNANGTLILSEGHALSDTLIRKLIRLDKISGGELEVFARPAD